MRTSTPPSARCSETPLDPKLGLQPGQRMVFDNVPVRAIAAADPGRTPVIRKEAR